MRWMIGALLSALCWSPTLPVAATDCSAEEHADLQRRLSELEAIVAALQIGRSGELPDEPVTTASEPAIESAGSLYSLKVDRSSSSHSRTLLSPSRGRMAEWLQPVERRAEIRTFIDFEYIDSGPDGSRGGDSTFDSHHVQVFLDSRLRDNLSAHAELEWEHSGDTIEVDQAFLAWTLHPGLTLDVGRFYTPFGIERFVWYSPTNALVSRPDPMREIVPGNFYANGLRVGGATDPERRFGINYELALSNGLGEDALSSRRGSRQNRDNNSDKAISGRLGMTYGSHFEIGTSLHQQQYDDDLDLRFVGFDLAARYQGFELRSEYVRADVDRPAGGVRGDLDQDGVYAQLSYTQDWARDLFPSITFATRYDDVDLDRALVGGDDRSRFSLGVNAAVYWRFRLKAEYQWTTESGPERDDDTVYLQAVVDF